MNIDSNFDYIVELEEEKIPTLKQNIADLEKERDKLLGERRNWPLLGVPPKPFNRGDYDNILSWLTFHHNEDYINNISSVIRSYGIRKPLIDKATVDIIDIILCIAVPAVSNILIERPDIHGFFFILDILGVSLISLAVYFAIAQVIFIWYFHILTRGKILRSNKKETKQIKAEISILTKQLKSYENLVEQYKISTLDTNKQISNLKKNTLDELRRVIEKTTSDIIPNIKSNKVKSRYSTILTKCLDILNIASFNGSIVSEISQIFNVYIPEINSLVIIFGGQDKKIIELLDNFEKHIDDKMLSASKANQFELDSRISALKSSILASQELGDDSKEGDIDEI